MRVLKKTAKEDMKIIHPMLNAIRKNDFRAMYKYEDIMINLDELMQSHKQNTEYEGRIKEAMKERKNTLAYKRQELIAGLSEEVAAIGIFDVITPRDIKETTKKLVENSPIETDYNLLKTQLIPNLIELNEKAKVKKVQVVPSNKVLPLLDARGKALKQKKHVYEILKNNGYIKNISIDIIKGV